MDEGRRATNNEQKMNARPKSGTGGLRGVKATFPHRLQAEKNDRKQLQHKFRGALENWLIKPRKPHGTAEVHDVEMADDVDASQQSTAAEWVDDAEEEQAPAHDNAADPGDDTQPLTPESLEVDNATAAPSASFEAKGQSSRGSAKTSKPKITDFFPITPSPAFSSRRRQQSSTESPEMDTSPPEDEPDVTWLGTPISELRRMPECGQRLPPLRDCPGQHTVLIRETRKLSSQSRWELIQDTLRMKYTCSQDLKVLEPDAAQHLFDSLLPDMVQLALRASELCTKPIPLLKEGEECSITLSQEQVACLLANAFFCTFPRRNSRKSDYANYPDINFYRACFFLDEPAPVKDRSAPQGYKTPRRFHWPS
ncbi:unnamed protein product [Merluccius merluccius]